MTQALGPLDTPKITCLWTSCDWVGSSTYISYARKERIFSKLKTSGFTRLESLSVNRLPCCRCHVPALSFPSILSYDHRGFQPLRWLHRRTSGSRSCPPVCGSGELQACVDRHGVPLWQMCAGVSAWSQRSAGEKRSLQVDLKVVL